MAAKSRNAVKIRGDSSSRDKSIIMDVISCGSSKIEKRVEKTATFSMDTSNII